MDGPAHRAQSWAETAENPLHLGYHAARHRGNLRTAAWHDLDVSVLDAPALVQRLKAIRDPQLRRFALADMLARGEPDAWVSVLADLLRHAARTDDGDAQAAVECLAHAVAMDPLRYAAREALYTAARNAELGAVARLFLDASPPTATEDELEAALAPQRPLKPRGRPLSLGERKSLARSARREFLVPMLRDPHPDVVVILLDNPHLTERDVVTVAAQRPAAPQSLACVAVHPRWSARYLVKRAVVLNPYTPTHVAVRLATTLRRNDLVEIARDSHLAPMLRSHAAELLVTARAP